MLYFVRDEISDYEHTMHHRHTQYRRDRGINYPADVLLYLDVALCLHRAPPRMVGLGLQAEEALPDTPIVQAPRTWSSSFQVNKKRISQGTGRPELHSVMDTPEFQLSNLPHGEDMPYPEIVAINISGS